MDQLRSHLLQPERVKRWEYLHTHEPGSVVVLPQGDIVILVENDSNDSKVTEQIPKECCAAVDESVEC